MTVSATTPEFVVLNRWRLREGTEEEFLKASQQGTEPLLRERGLGDRGGIGGPMVGGTATQNDPMSRDVSRPWRQGRWRCRNGQNT